MSSGAVCAFFFNPPTKKPHINMKTINLAGFFDVIQCAGTAFHNNTYVLLKVQPLLLTH